MYQCIVFYESDIISRKKGMIHNLFYDWDISKKNEWQQAKILRFSKYTSRSFVAIYPKNVALTVMEEVVILLYSISVPKTFKQNFSHGLLIICAL